LFRARDANPNDNLTMAAYAIAQTLEQLLRQRGGDLTPENVMKQAANLKDFKLGLRLPKSRINTSPTDYRVVTICNCSGSTAKAGMT
jgi:branched-chain amino acid transport system substrate-binding protein